jgi:hypothetical protein
VSLDAELDRLYGLPLEDFTRARNELAARLRREGEKDASAEVKGLAKPSRVAWVLNRLARDQPELVRRLLEAGDELGRVQEQALAGGQAEQLREAIAGERAAVHDLVEAARSLPSAEPSEATLDRVRASLSAVAGNEQARAELERGMVTREFERIGFPSLTGQVPEPAPTPTPRRATAARPATPAPAGGDELAEQRLRREEQRERVRALRVRVRELTRDETRAQQEARRAQAAAARAQQEARRVEAAAASARAEADLAERRYEQASETASALTGERTGAETALAEAEAQIASPRGRRPA